MLHSLCTTSRPIKPLPLTKFTLFLHKFSTNNTMQFSKPIRAETTVHQVPCFSSEEINRIAEQTFRRYTAESLPKRKGKGVAIVWFRNDLRVLDNEALLVAWVSSEAVLPVYCVDPRLFSTTRYFGFPKTGGLRAQFLIECLADLKKNLMKRDLDLLIQNGKPEEILPSLAIAYGVHTVYAQKETCSEEMNVERLVSKSLRKVVLSSSEGLSVKPNSTNSTKLELIWGSSMYHIDDLPFSCNSLPDVYTQFRKSVESKSKMRSCIKIPTSLGPAPSIKDWGCIPEIAVLGIEKAKVSKGMAFVGGESAAVSRVCEYFWTKNRLRTYKETRNGMLGPDYSTKFSPWLASGSLSPRFIYEEVKRFEREQESNDSTYWVLFELIWRDYFRFLSIKQGNSYLSCRQTLADHTASQLNWSSFNNNLGIAAAIEGFRKIRLLSGTRGSVNSSVLFKIFSGPRKVEAKWSQNQTLFDAWRNGQTGYPLIDANMKELLTTGFMSNRGRQIVCSFLVRDMNIDWRMGAEWFETCLLDYDPCSNYGNWTYGAGVGNDPREDRYFSIPKQAQNYDPEGEFVAYWLPQLRALPKEKRHFPGLLYIKPVVALKFGNTKTMNNKTMASGTRTTADENKWKGRKGNRTQ